MNFRFYDSDLNELFEYRKMISELSTIPIKLCNNHEHEELLIFMQRQIQSFEQAVQDRDNQILNLKRDKIELQEQIQQGIQQTRAELENLSRRYSLPQLETMSNELKNSEDTITALKEQLIEKEDIIKKNNEKFVYLSALEEDLKRVKDDNNCLQKLLEDFKSKEVELTEENARITTLLNSKSEVVSDKKIANVHKLHKLKQEITKNLVELKNQNSDFSKEVETWEKVLDDCLSSLPIESSDNDLEGLNSFKIQTEKEKCDLNYQIECRCNEIEEAKKEIAALKEINLSYATEIDENKLVIKQLTDNLHNLNKYVQVVEESKQDLETQLRNLEKQLTSAQEEILNMRKQINEKGTNSSKGLGSDETSKRLCFLTWSHFFFKFYVIYYKLGL